jgi:phosphoglucomutase
VQIIFALDVLCSVLDERRKLKLATPLVYQELGVVVNGPTSSVMEQLAYYLDFTVKRVEVGEANVATGGMALHDQGFHVPIMGEGSNGSVFNLDLLVREPLHTVRTLINFITRPELTKILLNCLHQVNRNKLAACSTEDQNKLTECSTNDQNKLAACFTEDKYDDYDLPQELFKVNFDAYFESQLWPRIAEEIRENFQGEPMAEFVNYEGEDELRGKGNRKTGAGGYKVEFYAKMQEGYRRHIGWIWFRPSGTERGVMRRGVSISHWDASNPRVAQVMGRVYKYIDAVLTNALNIVEEETLAMCPDQPQKR